MNEGDDAPPGMRWLSPAEAAATLGVTDRTMRRYVANGHYPVRHEGRRAYVLVPVPAVEPPAASAGLELRLAAEAAAQADARRRLERLEWVAQRLINRVEAVQRGRPVSGIGTPPQPAPDQPHAARREPRGGRPDPRDTQSSVPAW